MTTTEVELRRNDGSETFVLKATRVDPTVSNGLVTDSIISAASRQVLGGKLVLSAETYQVDFDIQGMESADYPNAGTYSNDDYGFKEELWRASHEWGFTLSDGLDVLYYDGKSVEGVITEFNPTEDLNQRKARTYDASLEFTHVDAYVSQ